MKNLSENHNRGTQEMVSHRKVASPLGMLTVVQENNEIIGVIQEHQPAPRFSVGEPDQRNSPVLDTAEQQLGEFFNGSRHHFELPFKLVGTLFQKNVWETLLTISYGETIYYAEVAKVMGKPRALQAVGTAVGKNPLSVLVPCHRVVAKNGNVNYAGGVENKEYLLSMESKYSQ